MLIHERPLTVKYYVQVEDIINNDGDIRLGWTNIQYCSSESEAKEAMAKISNRGRLRVARVTTATLATREQ